MAERKKRKATRAVKRSRQPVGRRKVIRTLAVGAGAMMLAGTVRGGDPIPEEDDGIHYVNYGEWSYPIVGIVDDNEGHFVVQFDDGLFTINPASLVFDWRIYFWISDHDAETIWYDGGGMPGEEMEYGLVTFIEYVEDVQVIG